METPDIINGEMVDPPKERTYYIGAYQYKGSLADWQVLGMLYDKPENALAAVNMPDTCNHKVIKIVLPITFLDDHSRSIKFENNEETQENNQSPAPEDPGV